MEIKISGRMDVLRAIDFLTDGHCKKCPERPALDPRLQRCRHKHCTTTCPVGLQLQELGKLLSRDVTLSKNKKVTIPKLKGVVKVAEQKLSSEKFGEILRTQRRKLKLTMGEVAKKAGISYATLSNAESGKNGLPTVTTIQKLAPVLGLDCDELLIKAGLAPAAPRQEKIKDEQVIDTVSTVLGQDTELDELKRENEDLHKKLETSKYVEGQYRKEAQGRIIELENAIKRMNAMVFDAAMLAYSEQVLGYKLYKSEMDVLKKEISQSVDMVNHPPHYTAGGVECIDAIDAATVGLYGGQAYNTGAVIKYMWRWSRKNGLEDLQKARWYLDRLIGTEKEGAR